MARKKEKNGTSGATTFAFVDIEEIVEGVTAEMPEVNENAVAEYIKNNELNTEPPIQNAGYSGKAFDPLIHRVDSNGRPLISKTGKFMKRPGRTHNSQIGGASKEQKSPPQNIGCEMVAKTTVDSITTICQMVGGEEFKPTLDPAKGIDERATMVDALRRYYEVKNISDVPPGILVVVTLSTYLIPRLFLPKTAGKIERLKNFLKSKLGKKYAQFNSGGNGKREDDVGQKTSDGVPVTRL